MKLQTGDYKQIDMRCDGIAGCLVSHFKEPKADHYGINGYLVGCLYVIVPPRLISVAAALGEDRLHNFLDKEAGECRRYIEMLE